jgi:preprotein translocase subunit SecG
MQILTITQILISVGLIAVILFQQRGTGLGAAFGGEGGVYRTKRGIEKYLFISTIVLAALFILNAILNIVI